jgi:hypothetical protein
VPTSLSLGLFTHPTRENARLKSYVSQMFSNDVAIRLTLYSRPQSLLRYVYPMTVSPTWTLLLPNIAEPYTIFQRSLPSVVRRHALRPQSPTCRRRASVSFKSTLFTFQITCSSLFAAEALERTNESQRIARLASLVPFFKLEALTAPQLVSIGNFLRTELSTLAHATQYYAGQYSYVQKQLADINTFQLKKLNIEDSEMGSSVPDAVPDSHPQPSSGGESSSNVEVIEIDNDEEEEEGIDSLD